MISYWDVERYAGLVQEQEEKEAKASTKNAHVDACGFLVVAIANIWPASGMPLAWSVHHFDADSNIFSVL